MWVWVRLGFCLLPKDRHRIRLGRAQQADRSAVADSVQFNRGGGDFRSNTSDGFCSLLFISTQLIVVKYMPPCWDWVLGDIRVN